MPFAKNANSCTVENQELEKGSMLSLYRSLIRLRSKEHALRMGVCDFLEQKNTNLMVYTRTLEEARLLLVMNFSPKVQSASLAELGLQGSDGEKIFSTSSQSAQPRFSSDAILLAGYEAVVFRLA